MKKLVSSFFRQAELRGGLQEINAGLRKLELGSGTYFMTLHDAQGRSKTLKLTKIQ